jgi:hypothetical protein
VLRAVNARAAPSSENFWRRAHIRTLESVAMRNVKLAMAVAQLGTGKKASTATGAVDALA